MWAMLFNAVLANRGGNTAGFSVPAEVVEVTLDTDERAITPPADLVAALAQAGASEAWTARSYSHQRQWVTAIEDAKSPATRERRIAKTVADLLA